MRKRERERDRGIGRGGEIRYMCMYECMHVSETYAV